MSGSFNVSAQCGNIASNILKPAVKMIRFLISSPCFFKEWRIAAGLYTSSTQDWRWQSRVLGLSEGEQIYKAPQIWQASRQLILLWQASRQLTLLQFSNGCVQDSQLLHNACKLHCEGMESVSIFFGHGWNLIFVVRTNLDSPVAIQDMMCNAKDEGRCRGNETEK